MIRKQEIAILIVSSFVLAMQLSMAQSVGINDDGSQPDSRAILDLKSNNKGVLFPRISDEQRNALFQDIPEGMLIYNSSDQQLQIFIDDQWFPLSMGIPENTHPDTIIDVDGNVYDLVYVGNQLWMAENLKTTHYNDGVEIANVTSSNDWTDCETGAFCWYDNDEATYKDLYGALYNWHAVNTGKLCPSGWHVPTEEEWRTMESYLGMPTQQLHYIATWRGTNQGSQMAGDASLWAPGALVSDPEFNKSGFHGLPGGHRRSDGNFYWSASTAHWYTSTLEDAVDLPYYRSLSSSETGVFRDFIFKDYGYSVRCLKD